MKPYTTSQGQKSFTGAGHLKTHLCTNSEVKTFACQQCKKSFTGSCDLKKHMRTHSGEKSLACQQYKQRFTIAECLKTHVRVDSGEKTFVCHQCEESFTLAGNLKTHTRRSLIIFMWQKVHWTQISALSQGWGVLAGRDFICFMMASLSWVSIRMYKFGVLGSLRLDSVNTGLTPDFTYHWIMCTWLGLLDENAWHIHTICL